MKSGKIKSVQVVNPKTNDQVIYKGSVYLVCGSDPSEASSGVLLRVGDNHSIMVEIADLTKLIVEYEEFSHYSQDLMKIAVYTTKQLCLDYANWKEVLETGLVDKNKKIDFDFDIIYFDEPNHPMKRTLSGCKTIAKFKPKKYTEYELLKHMMEFGEHVALEITGNKIQCAGELMKYWKEHETNEKGK